ncbi:hypothetical protein [Bacillus sp. V59.32b]|uniref:hypothetical protein n=1 Tax=Bacillus sp. V59.32b TaxID=1758642 RepID=UPI0020B1370A
MSIPMKNLIPKSFGKKKLAIVISSAVLAAATIGLLFYFGTKQTVALTLDGEKR